MLYSTALGGYKYLGNYFLHKGNNFRGTDEPGRGPCLSVFVD